MKEKQEIKEIVERFDRGYTNTLYGNSFYVKLQKDTDFERLIELVKKLTMENIEIIKEAFIEGYKQRAESSDLIFDNASRMYAISLFDEWIKGR